MMNQVTMRRGTEGPKHDPYGYDEVIVAVAGHVCTCHLGLGIWIKVDGEKHRVTEANYQEMFQLLTGDTPENWISNYEEDHREDIEDPMGCLADYE